MRLIRPILALVIAVSVALLPRTGFAVGADGSAARLMAGLSETTVSVEAIADGCCLDDTGVKPCDQQKGQCPMAFCAAQAVSIGFTSSFWLTLPIASGDKLPFPLDLMAPLHSGSPPFEPPRI